MRPRRPSDADQVLAIYQAGLDTGDASFETAAPAWDAFDQGKLPRHVAVAVTGERCSAGLPPAPCHRGRCTRGVIQHSVYVRPDAQGRGIGGGLLDALIGSTEAAGI
jgi:L-amino acid N-acyltransferase YncA